MHEDYIGLCGDAPRFCVRKVMISRILKSKISLELIEGGCMSLKKMLKETKDPRATIIRLARDPELFRTVQKPEFVREVILIFEENPGLSMKEVAQQK